jgi:hypothetical protein
MVGGSACGAAPPAVPVPALPPAAPPSTVQPAAASSDVSCAKLLPQDEAVAVLGLPLDGLAVGDVRGVPATAVGRTARETCTYTVVNPVWPVKGVVLVVTVGWFVDPASARAQHERNVADVAGGGAVAPEHVGAATAAVVVRRDRTLLLSVFRRINVDVEIANAVARPLTSRAALDDVVRRVLARLVNTRSTA